MLRLLGPLAQRCRRASLFALGVVAGIGWLMSCGHGGGAPATGGAPPNPASPEDAVLYHASFGHVATSVDPGCVAFVGDGTVRLAVAAGASAGIAPLDPGTFFVPLERSGVFFSARVAWLSDTIDSTHHFDVGVGPSLLTGGFGFRAHGSALQGYVRELGTRTELDLGTPLATDVFVNVVAVRRASAVEFFVGGVSRGSLPMTSGAQAAPPYHVDCFFDAGAVTFPAFEANSITVGIPNP
jgi:hypothetical protein